MKPFVIDTNDNRMMYVKTALKDRGYTVYNYSDYDGVDAVNYIFSPAKKFREHEILNFNNGSLVFSGNMDRHVEEELIGRNVTHVNLLSDEVYAYENAIYTAEGALMLIIRNTARSIYDENMLILGYGRVGKAMANLLNAIGVKFAIAARRYEERASAYLLTQDIRSLDLNFDGIDVIINTIPARIIGVDAMKKISKDCYILDLASYGILNSESSDGLNYALEHGIPGRYAPESAGISLMKSVLRSIG